MHPARRSAIYNIAALLLTFETIYIIGANWFLRSDSFMQTINLNSNPQKLLIRLDSPKTYWPGDVRLKELEISGHDGPVKWNIKTGPLKVQLNLASLLHRTLEVDRVNLSTAQVKIELWQPRLPPSPASKKNPFWLKFHKIHIAQLERVQIHSYVYSGKSSLEGSFELWPGRELNIFDSRINIETGELRRDDKVVLKDMHGSLETSLLNHLPQTDKGLDILDRIKSASLTLKGNLDDSTFVNFYLKGVPWLRMAKLEGALDGSINIRNGGIASGTKGEVKAKRIDFELGPYTSHSGGRVKWSLDDQALKLKTSLNDYQFFSKSRKDSFMKGQALQLKGDTRSLQLKQMFSKLHDLGIALQVDKGRITDLGIINDFIPVTDKLKVHRGFADVDAKIYLSTTAQSKQGFLKIKTSDAQTQFRTSNFAGDIDLESTIRDSESGIDTFEITDTKLYIHNVNIRGGKNAKQKKIRDWKGTVQIPLAHIRPKHNVIAGGDFRMRFDNAEPMLIALGEEFRLFRVLKKIAAVDDLTGSGMFQIGPRLLTLENVQFSSSDVAFKGRYQFVKPKHKFLLWFQYDTLKAAIEFDGKKSSYALNNTVSWYDKHGQWPKIELQKNVTEGK